MRKKVERFRTVTFLLMTALFTILQFVYADGFTTKSSSFLALGSLVCAGIVVADYLSRRYIKNAILFFGIHLAMIAGAFFVAPGDMDKVIMVIVSASYLYLGIGFWRTEIAERSLYEINIPGSLLFMFIIVYIHASLSKTMPDSIAVYAYIAGISYVILYYIREYLNKFLAYSLARDNISKEMEETFVLNISFIGLFGLVSVFGIMVANLFFSDSSFNFVGRFLRYIARAIVGLIGTGKAEVQEIVTEQETTTEIRSTEIATRETVKRAAKPIQDGIDKSLEIFIILLFILALIAIVIAVYKFIKHYMHKHGRAGDIVEKITYGDQKEKMAKNENKEKAGLFGSNDTKVRKIYKAYILSAIKKNSGLHIIDSNTTDEIQEKAENVVDKNNLMCLTKVYKKARYSGKEITKEDVAFAKKFSKF